VRGQFGHARPDALAITEDDMDKLLLTPTEAATALGIGRSKVYELMQTGQLQSVHIGACRRVPTDAIHSFLHKLRTAASA
jgi:excisionase family DNA binding protein